MKNELVDIFFSAIEVENNVDALKRSIKYFNKEELDEILTKILEKLNKINYKMSVLIDVEDEEKLE